jgi:hypothetical protein
MDLIMLVLKAKLVIFNVVKANQIDLIIVQLNPQLGDNNWETRIQTRRF